jgi:hypothetical protein
VREPAAHRLFGRRRRHSTGDAGRDERAKTAKAEHPRHAVLAEVQVLVVARDFRHVRSGICRRECRRRRIVREPEDSTRDEGDLRERSVRSVDVYGVWPLTRNWGMTMARLWMPSTVPPATGPASLSSWISLSSIERARRSGWRSPSVRTPGCRYAGVDMTRACDGRGADGPGETSARRPASARRRPVAASSCGFSISFRNYEAISALR